MAKPIYTEGFVEDLAQSPQAIQRRAQIKAACELLQTFPELGTSTVARSLAKKCGSRIRKLSASPFVIVYEFNPETDEVYFYGLEHERNIR